MQEIKQGADGLVRKVMLKYKLPDENYFRTVEHPIHGIAVIVPIEEQIEIECLHKLNPDAKEFHSVIRK